MWRGVGLLSTAGIYTALRPNHVPYSIRHPPPFSPPVGSATRQGAPRALGLLQVRGAARRAVRVGQADRAGRLCAREPRAVRV